MLRRTFQSVKRSSSLRSSRRLLSAQALPVRKPARQIASTFGIDDNDDLYQMKRQFRTGSSGGSSTSVTKQEDRDEAGPEGVDETEEVLGEVKAPETTAMKPSEVVRELDRFIVGQSEAKRAVALALRNRWRRKHLPEGIREEIMPKNILMIGPTGVGKTEIARRLARIANAPFIKVEATKYTEVGFHGKDVDTIIHDLVEQAIIQAKLNKQQQMRARIQKQVEERILVALQGEKALKRNRDSVRDLLRKGLLEDQIISIEVQVKDEAAAGLNNVLAAQGVIIRGGTRKEERKIKIKDARPLLEDAEGEKLINRDEVVKEALAAVQEDGIVFIDEIDKICSSKDRYWSADASAEGVQRDLLPIIEGSTVTTKHGNVQTDHILFIASGAFHSAKPSDMLPELQGRLPVRVELQGLTEENFHQILTEPESNLLEQQRALLNTEGVTVSFQKETVRHIAKLAFDLNRSVEDIGARRLHTVIERLMEDIGFDAPELQPGTVIEITPDMAQGKIGPLLKKVDLQKFIL